MPRALAGLAALLLALIGPAGARAVRWTPGAAIGRPGLLQYEAVALAPTGRTGVLWQTYGPKASDCRFYLAAGPEPDQLAAPVVVDTAPLRGATSPQLLAADDGTLVACFAEATERGLSRSGCAFAPPGAGFGPVRVVSRFRGNEEDVPRLTAAMRPDGRVQVVLARHTRSGARLVTFTLDAAGSRGAPHLLGETTGEGAALARTDAGTIAVSYQAAGAGGLAKQVVRLLEPGATVFGPPLALPLDVGATPVGGRGLALVFSSDDADAADRVSTVGADGAVGPAAYLPRSRSGPTSGAVAIGPDGAPFVVSNTQYDGGEGDPGDPPAFGEIAVGALQSMDTPGSAVRLSTPKRVATDPFAAVTDDGTASAVWSEDGTMRAALRAPGAAAFAAPVSLGRDFNYAPVYAASGSRAVAAWFESTGRTKLADPITGRELTSQVRVAALG